MWRCRGYQTFRSISPAPWRFWNPQASLAPLSLGHEHGPAIHAKPCSSAKNSATRVGRDSMLFCSPHGCLFVSCRTVFQSKIPVEAGPGSERQKREQKDYLASFSYNRLNKQLAEASQHLILDGGLPLSFARPEKSVPEGWMTTSHDSYATKQAMNDTAETGELCHQSNPLSIQQAIIP
ncbi:hypothetical protein GGI42DRAFT_109002 [Trichoderma sp. SZMC 28013]